MKKRYRIVNKRKFISFLALILTIITISTMFLLMRDNKVYSSTYEENYINVKVEKGDTLWNIAINYMPKGYDVRKMVFEIIEFNDIEGASIYPGDLIKVPIKYNSK
ncbi:MAG: LysM peptidoglycan-binding domain-containing protein [Tissierellia bacterium]|nr:LysM peptidoglycan-binding domain-containing protein [Tissierellia bacterium]